LVITDADLNMGPPAAKVYEGHSGGIIETLTGLLEKAQAQHEKATKAEMNSQNNFSLLKQSLSDEVRFANKDMTEAKKNLAQAQGDKSTAEGDLSVTTADLKSDQADQKTLGHDCMSKSQDYETESRSRAEELKALAAAKQAISSNTGGADALSYSFVQVSQDTKLSSGADLANFEAVRFVRDLARKNSDPALTQLASRMASAIRFGTASGEDPFRKVKGLIRDMIATLEADAKGDASHKAYCDKQTAETKAKQQEAPEASSPSGQGIDISVPEDIEDDGELQAYLREHGPEEPPDCDAHVFLPPDEPSALHMRTERARKGDALVIKELEHLRKMPEYSCGNGLDYLARKRDGMDSETAMLWVFTHPNTGNFPRDEKEEAR